MMRKSVSHNSSSIRSMIKNVSSKYGHSNRVVMMIGLYDGMRLERRWFSNVKGKVLLDLRKSSEKRSTSDESLSREELKQNKNFMEQAKKQTKESNASFDTKGDQKERDVYEEERDLYEDRERDGEKIEKEEMNYEELLKHERSRQRIENRKASKIRSPLMQKIINIFSHRFMGYVPMIGLAFVIIFVFFYSQFDERKAKKRTTDIFNQKTTHKSESKSEHAKKQVEQAKKSIESRHMDIPLNVLTEKNILSSDKKKNLKVQVCLGNIIDDQADAVICQSNEKLHHLDGTSYAVIAKGGEDFQDRCEEYVKENGSLSVKESAIIPATRSMNCKYVINCVCPEWKLGRRKEVDDLGETVYNALMKAEEQKLKTVMLTSLVTGNLEFPEKECARGIMRGISKYSRERADVTSIERIRVNIAISRLSFIFQQMFEKELKDL